MTAPQHFPLEPIQPHRAIYRTGGVVLALLVIAFAWIDVPVIVWARENHCTWWINWPELLTHVGHATFWLIFLIGGGLLLLLLKRPVWGMRLLHAGLAMALAGLMVSAIKIITGRYRPMAYFDHGLWGFDLLALQLKHMKNSFPSGHSCNMGALCTALWMWKPRWWWLWLIVFALITSTRVLVVTHWPSDVLAGGYLGLVVTLLLYNPLGRLLKVISPCRSSIDR